MNTNKLRDELISLSYEYKEIYQKGNPTIIELKELLKETLELYEGEQSIFFYHAKNIKAKALTLGENDILDYEDALLEAMKDLVFLIDVKKLLGED